MPELSSLILRSLKKDAEEFLQHPVKDVVISISAYFSNEQRKHTRLVAELAGLNAVRLISEPTAAAMAYGLHVQQSIHSLVPDLGGDTFDVTVLKYTTPVIEVHASADDNFLGGEDFTHMLVDEVLKRTDVTETTLSESELTTLCACVEAAKCSNQSPLHIHWQYQEETREREFYENELGDLWLPLLDRLRVPIEQALRDTHLRPSQTDSLVLVSGASRMPLVQRVAVRLFGKLSYQSCDPSTIVALGTTIRAACRLRGGDIGEVALADICPYSLGIEVNRQGASDVFSPIIERNTTVPVSRIETYSTMCPGQDSVTVSVHREENHEVKNNILMEFFGVPLEKIGAYQSVDIRLNYDVNGLLEVDVFLEDSSVKPRVINHSPVTLSAQQIGESRTRLSALKVYPRNMLISHTFKAKLEELRTRALDDKREGIGRVVTDFDATLQSNDMAHMDEVRRRASNYLAIEIP